MKAFKQIIQFLKDVSEDPRIPPQDKKTLLILIALIISPIDFIPDWIPVLGIVDDLFMLALVLDYFFEVLDSQVILSHFPFGMRTFLVLKKSSRLVSWLTPQFLRDRIWKYKPEAF